MMNDLIFTNLEFSYKKNHLLDLREFGLEPILLVGGTQSMQCSVLPSPGDNTQYIMN